MTEHYVASDGKPRCKWCGSAPELLDYHDTEWGFLVRDDIRIFEKLCLEGFKSGANFRNILKRRDNFRTAYLGFDFEKIAKFDIDDISRLIRNREIIGDDIKIVSVINNARRAIQMVEKEGSLANFFMQYEAEAHETKQDQGKTKSELSIKISKELRRRGWRLVGPTTIYAFMQAMGLINDHAEGCVIRAEVEKAKGA